MPTKRRGQRILGPYRHDSGWRVVEVAADGSRTRSQFETEGKARRYIQLLQQQLVAADYDTSTALEEYETFLKAKGNKKGSIDRTRWSVTRFFPKPVPLWSLTPATCKKRYEELTAEVAVDSHRNALAEVKTFFSWCMERGILAKNPAANVKGIGKRKKRKPQLRIKEARKWLAVAHRQALDGDDGAIAALMALLLGMRSSEIIDRRVRDLDEDELPGDLLWIPDSKTEAGRRTLEVPELLRPLLLQLAIGKRPDSYLFPVRRSKRAVNGGAPEKPHWRDWPRKQVKRLCAAAGVPSVTAHGMRGVLATLTIERGMAGHLVAQMLGHEDQRTTMDSYAARGAAETGARKRGLAKLLSFPPQDGTTNRKSENQGT